jgi:hypothetical protein
LKSLAAHRWNGFAQGVIEPRVVGATIRRDAA